MSVSPAAPTRRSDVGIGLLHSPDGRPAAVKCLYFLPRSSAGRRKCEVSLKKQTATGVSQRKRRDLIPRAAAAAAVEVRQLLTVSADAAWRRIGKKRHLNTELKQ